MVESKKNDQVVPAHEFKTSHDALFRSVYCNQTAFSSTAFDISMTFGEIVDVDAVKREVKVEQHVRVIMSPLHFKIFAAVCAQNVKNFENAYGVINAPLGEGDNVELGGEPVPIPSMK